MDTGRNRSRKRFQLDPGKIEGTQKALRYGDRDYRAPAGFSDSRRQEPPSALVRAAFTFGICTASWVNKGWRVSIDFYIRIAPGQRFQRLVGERRLHT
jgi:hypothetical protein